MVFYVLNLDNLEMMKNLLTKVSLSCICYTLSKKNIGINKVQRYTFFTWEKCSVAASESKYIIKEILNKS